MRSYHSIQELRNGIGSTNWIIFNFIRLVFDERQSKNDEHDGEHYQSSVYVAESLSPTSTITADYFTASPKYSLEPTKSTHRISGDILHLTGIGKSLPTMAPKLATSGSKPKGRPLRACQRCQTQKVSTKSQHSHRQFTNLIFN